MANNKFTEEDVIPKKLAVKYNPPTIALEYHLSNTKTDLLLQINLEECIKQYDDPNDICKWIFSTYKDIINPKFVSQNQMLNLIQRVLLMKRIGNNKKKTSDTGSQEQELFEPDPCRKENTDEFYKSNQNFYKTEKEKEAIDEDINKGQVIEANLPNKNKLSATEERSLSYSEEFIKNEINESNRISNYLNNKNSDEEEESHSPHANEHEFQNDNNLAEYFHKKQIAKDSTDNLYNYMDEISVESLNSDDKF